jgi:hypothetical protein
VCSSFCIYSLIFEIVDPYSWELTSYGTNSIGLKKNSNIFFIPPIYFWGLFLPPLRFTNSSSTIIVSDGPAPLICPLYFSSYEVFGFGIRTRGSY